MDKALITLNTTGRSPKVGPTCRPVVRGGEAERKSRAPVSWGPRVQCRINPWQATRLRASNNSRPLSKNKFLFISVLSVSLVVVGPYWSWWAPRLHLVSLVGLMDKTALPELRAIVYKC